MLTRAWARPTRRSAADLDFVGAFPADLTETVERFRPILLDEDVADGVRFDQTAFDAVALWQDSAFPGVRLVLRLGLETPDRDLHIDVGFNDPLVAAAEPFDYPTLFGPAARVWCCRPETMVGWKLHGLAEKGERRWRPKDLHDLWLTTGGAILSPDDLPPAIAAAFTSRGDPVSAAAGVLSATAWWGSKRSRARWDAFCQESRDTAPPEDLAVVVATVAERLRPAFARLGLT
jgi:hypothetical protein